MGFDCLTSYNRIDIIGTSIPTFVKFSTLSQWCYINFSIKKNASFSKCWVFLQFFLLPYLTKICLIERIARILPCCVVNCHSPLYNNKVEKKSIATTVRISGNRGYRHSPQASQSLLLLAHRPCRSRCTLELDTLRLIAVRLQEGRAFRQTYRGAYGGILG